MQSRCPAGRHPARGWGWRHAGRSDPAVHAWTWTSSPGERVLLLGPSGAGKSTLLHALAGVLGDDDDEREQRAGTLLIDGARPAARRGRAGLMQQDPDTQVVLSRVGDDVAFGAENLAVRAGRDLAPGPRSARRRRAGPGSAGGPAGRTHGPTSAGPSHRGTVRRPKAAPGAGRNPGHAPRTAPAGRTHRQPRSGRASWRCATPWAAAWTRPAPPWWWWSTGWPSGKTLVDRIVVLAPGPGPDARRGAAGRAAGPGAGGGAGHAQSSGRLGARLRSGHPPAPEQQPTGRRELLLAAEALAVVPRTARRAAGSLRRRWLSGINARRSAPARP